MRTTIRAAVIGCGIISYEHLTYLKSAPGVDLVAVCDTSRAAAAFAASQYSAEAHYVDMTTMLKAARPDVVHVLTPPSTHFAVVMACLAAECHVICEKPAARTIGELEVMLECAQRHHRRLMESQNLLFNDEVISIAKDMAAGALGEVREVDVMLSFDLTASRFGDLNLSSPAAGLPGGAVHDFLPHLAYLFLHFSGAPVESVSGRLLNASGNARVGFDHLDALVVAGQVRGRLRVASDLQPNAFRLIVRGTRGSRETDLYNSYMRREGGRNIRTRIAIEHLTSGMQLASTAFTNLRNKVLQHGTYHGLPRLLDSFYTTLRAGQPQPIPVSSMRTSALLIDQLVALQAVSS